MNKGKEDTKRSRNNAANKLFAPILLALLLPFLTSAASYSQPTFTAPISIPDLNNSANGRTRAIQFPIGTGMSGILNTAYAYTSFEVNDAQPKAVWRSEVFVICYIDAGYTNRCSGSDGGVFSNGTTITSGTGVVGYTFASSTSPYTLHPSDYYAINIGNFCASDCSHIGFPPFSAATTTFWGATAPDLCMSNGLACTKAGSTISVPLYAGSPAFILNTTGTDATFATSTATTTPACTVDCNSNVLFLPGIEASRLYRPQVVGDPDKLLWEPYGDADALALAMNPDGTSVRDDIYTFDILSNAYIPFKGDVYRSFMSDMDDLKTGGKIEDWSAVPYDWRLSLDDILTHGKQTGRNISYLDATSTPYIEQELRRLAASSRTGKVTIIAHSNGGLVGKALMQKLGATTTAALIDKIIFVAVPQTGTPKAVGAILHGFEQSLPVSWFPAALSADTARMMAQHMPSAYNLLPYFQYFTHTDDPVVTFDDSLLLAPWRAKYGDHIHSSERLRDFLTDPSRPAMPTAEEIKNPIVGNPALLQKAETLHDTELDTWTPPAGVRVIEIAGWGEDTLKTIAYYQGMAGICTERRANSTCAAIVQTPVLDYKPEMTVDGDGTVVVPSALWTTGSERYWANLKNYNDGFAGTNVDREHADILEIPDLRHLIRNLLEATTPIDDENKKVIFDATPIAKPEDDRLLFTLHSPLTLDLYDDLGNHTGVATSTGFLEENIPGSRYERFGGVTYTTAPASTTIRVIMHGTAEGSFTLDVEETRAGAIVASTTFAGIPSSTTTTATLTVPQGGGIASSSPLTVDENGDGRTDLLLAPKEGGAVMPDITPPEAILTFSTTTDDIIISGRDEGEVSVRPSPILSTSTIQYTLADESGNTATLTFDRIREKESKNDRHGHIKARLLSIAYGTLSTTTDSVFPKNEIQYEWERDKEGLLKELEQEIKVKKDFTLRAKYDAKKNETKIYFVDKENKEKLKETRAGLVLTRIVTKGGELGVEY